MKDGNNQTTILIAIVVLIIIFGSNVLFLLPLLAIGGLAYYVVKQQKTQVISTNPNNNMNSFDINSLMGRAKRTGMITVFVILGIILLFNMVRVIPAGQTGVYHLFGKVGDNEVSSGIHLINPLASLVLMSIRTEEYTMSIATTEGQRLGDDSIQALTKEGLEVDLDMTILYHLIEDRASDVYRDLGTNYGDKVIRPEVRSAIREIIALYEAKDIYSDKREEAAGKIREVLAENLNPRGIEVESVLLRNISLPDMLTQAIEDKLAAEQEAQKYDFVLQREEKEAERKRIEAAGQRDAQQIINQSLSDRYLQYLYIQNLENREGTIYVPYDLPLLRGL